MPSNNMDSLDIAFIEKLRFNQDGLIPAIAQDWLDGAVLMMAWMNRLSLEKTIKEREVHYWSRRRKELWHKGSTSGHFQKLKSIYYDCDADTILLSVQQEGNIACHKGFRSCFFKKVLDHEEIEQTSIHAKADSCSELSNVIEQRKISEEPGSYTKKLFQGGKF